MSTEVNNILHILVKDEKTWLSMAEEITSNSKIPAKDLLHDFYIALHSKIDSKKVKINDILYNDSLNKAFIYKICLLYTSPSPRDRTRSRMPSSA